MKRKIIPVLVAIVLIIIIGAVGIGSVLIEKYSYSDERADLNEYFGVSGEQLAIVLQDEIVEEKAILRDGICYFDIDTVHRYLNEGFYVDRTEGLLLYTTAAEIISVPIGGTTVNVKTAVNGTAQTQELGYVAVLEEGGNLYLAADYVKRTTNYSVDIYDRHVQMYTRWGTKTVDSLTKDTAVRVRGGIKSPILSDLTAGAQVEVLETMETWSKVKTEDSIIGYVENKLLANTSKGQAETIEEIPVTDYVAPEYTSVAMEGKVSLGWHAIGGVGGNSTLDSMAAGANGMNVIAPTWFSLNDEEGNFRSFATKDYVDRAHALGLKVWGVWDDFNYNYETNSSVSVGNVLGKTSTRQKLVANIISMAVELGLDGVNLDFEKINEETGAHYVQFVRELSVECRRNGLTLSIDNYVPYNFRDYYRLDIQGQVADYVIIMGYDEHWHGSGDPGSVASIDYVSYGITKALEAVPAEKLMNALPFYTILWKTEGSKVTDEYLTINNTADFLSRVKITPQWDEETCQNYAKWTSGNIAYQIWIEDEQSIAAKLSVMATHDIAGVAVWRLGYGTDSIWNLIRGYVGQ
ncbi:MAG: SH3 domain-containing protein [Lachnospiraceae bacterium]|nr:SH3 domain-containing protein [Lachnospiraceae bacterium]